MRLNPNEFAKFLGERADRHDGYIMCTVGQDPRKLNQWYFDQYKDRTAYTAKQEAAALKWKETAERVWDCQGLADGYVTEMLGEKINVRARNNYASWCGVKGEGDIPAERRVPGAAVFMDNGSYIHHVGFLEKPVKEGAPEGDWYVIEARGVLYGVVRTKLSGRNWNRWGWMTEYFDYSVFDVQEPKDEVNEYGWRNLKYGMHGEDVAALQEDLIALNYDLGDWGADGDFGHDTKEAVKAFQHDHGLTADGIAGPKTFAKLDELLVEDGDKPEQAEPEKTIEIAAGSWHIRNQPSTQGAIKGYAQKGEQFAPSGMTAPSWIGILFHDEPAWVSEKAVKA